MKVDVYDYFRIEGDTEFFFRFKGSREENHGGVVGRAFQARRCLWEDDVERLDQLSGEEVWVQEGVVVERWAELDDAEEAAKEHYFREP